MTQLSIFDDNTELADQHIMVDIETMGTEPDSVILSIGAVRFDMETIRASFEVLVDIQSCLDAGLKVNAKTLQWWMKQSDAARRLLTDNTSMHLPLREALEAFNTFVSDKEVWGNGAGFDNVIIKHAMAAVGVTPAWEFWTDRCYRTVKALRVPSPTNPALKRMIARGDVELADRIKARIEIAGGHRIAPKVKPAVAHSALADATAQAQHLININRELLSRGVTIL